MTAITLPRVVLPVLTYILQLVGEPECTARVSRSFRTDHTPAVYKFLAKAYQQTECLKSYLDPQNGADLDPQVLVQRIYRRVMNRVSRCALAIASVSCGNLNPHRLCTLSNGCDFWQFFLAVAEVYPEARELTAPCPGDLLTRVDRARSWMMEHQQLFTSTHPLNLTGRLIANLPEEIFLLKKMQALQLSRNLLSSLHDAMWDMEFSYINLNHNRFTAVPEVMKSFRRLLALHIDHNRLAVFDCTGLTKLRELTLAHNQLTEVPKELEVNQDLFQINLEGNKLSTLPRELLNCTKMALLDLHDNQFTTLPDFLDQFQELKFLSIAGNPLKELPPHFNRLTGLEILEVDASQAERLPFTPAQRAVMQVRS